MATKASKIIYTKTDEAPMLATYSFLPIVRNGAAGIMGVDPAIVEAAWFEMARRVYSREYPGNSREQAARDTLKKLFGD